MKDPQAYKGREQTYLKHFFLEHYLERVAYNIGWGGDFVYIDGFSGPWRSTDEAFEDTSFMIAVQKLRTVRDSLAEHEKRPRIRCVFIEKDAQAFAKLERATETIKDIEFQVLNSEFEAALPRIADYLGGSFALTFIDPTGWTGFALQTIATLLRKRGEVLINFMFDHMNRFKGDERDAISRGYTQLFGGPGWEDAVDAGEDAMLEFYQVRLKQLCEFDYATRTRILWPLKERTYFHLVYATRHPKGLIEFRRVEKKFLKEQGIVRADAMQASRIQRTRQGELFREADAGGGSISLDEEQRRGHRRARDKLLADLHTRSSIPYEEALPPLLEFPTIDEPTAKRIIRALHDEDELTIVGLQKNQRLPKAGCHLRLNLQDPQ